MRLFRSARDVARLKRRFPQFNDYSALAEGNCAVLAEAHQRYVSTISTEDVAASMNSCAFLLGLCEATAPRRIADLGSGFSSFTFRGYARTAEPEVEVWSVDDSEQWLDKTREFLAGQSVSTDNLVTWDEFQQSDRGQFDLVLHDLGSTVPKRIETLRAALALARPGGLVFLDDLHKKDYRPTARKVLDEAGLDYLDLKSLLKDQYGRYGWLVFC